jgi:hypothetical protein
MAGAGDVLRRVFRVIRNLDTMGIALFRRMDRTLSRLGWILLEYIRDCFHGISVASPFP